MRSGQPAVPCGKVQPPMSTVDLLHLEKRYGKVPAVHDLSHD